jgi:hypothetical protein
MKLESTAWTQQEYLNLSREFIEFQNMILLKLF